MKEEKHSSHEPKSRQKTSTRYWEGVGRRKTAVARVRLMKGSGSIVVNDKKIDAYFPLSRYREVACAPLRTLKLTQSFDAAVRITGGGVNAQAEAIRHGIARALSLAEADFKQRLRQGGFLTRDPRMVERKKYGLKKARRAPQWAKR